MPTTAPSDMARMPRSSFSNFNYSVDTLFEGAAPPSIGEGDESVNDSIDKLWEAFDLGDVVDKGRFLVLYELIVRSAKGTRLDIRKMSLNSLGKSRSRAEEAYELALLGQEGCQDEHSVTKQRFQEAVRF